MYVNIYDISNLIYRNEIILFGFDVFYFYIKVKKIDWAYFRKSVFCTVNGNIYKIILYYICIFGFIENEKLI